MKIDFNAENYVICACYGLEWARSGETLHKKPPNNGRIVRTYGECPGGDRAKGEGEGGAKNLQVVYLHKPKQTHAHTQSHTFYSQCCIPCNYGNVALI